MSKQPPQVWPHPLYPGLYLQTSGTPRKVQGPSKMKTWGLL